MKIEKLLLGVAVALTALSIFSIQWEILSDRWLRIFTSGIFFLLAIKIFGLKEIWKLLIFGSLIVCDILLLEWEFAWAKRGYYSIHILIILSLMFLTIKDMEWRRISLFEIGSAVLFLIFCLLIFLALREYFSIEDLSLKILFNINGFLIVSLAVLAFFYSVNDSQLLATSFFLGILSLILSELILFAIYFLDVLGLRYIDNFFYVVGFFFLLKALLKNKLLKESNIDLEEKEEVRDTNRGGIYR